MLAKAFRPLSITLALFLAFWSVTHAAEPDGTEVISSEIIRTHDAKGGIIDKRITKKFRSRTVVDFEEANIEGKVKKPTAAYLLHGADLDFKHLYRIRHNQKDRII